MIFQCSVGDLTSVDEIPQEIRDFWKKSSNIIYRQETTEETLADMIASQAEVISK